MMRWVTRAPVLAIKLCNTQQIPPCLKKQSELGFRTGITVIMSKTIAKHKETWHVKPDIGENLHC